MKVGFLVISVGLVLGRAVGVTLGKLGIVLGPAEGSLVVGECVGRVEGVAVGECVGSL